MGYKIKALFKYEELYEKSNCSIKKIHIVWVPRYAISTYHIKVDRKIDHSKYAYKDI